MTADPANIPKIFTQDTMVHIGKLIREESFVPKQVERHPMLRGWNSEQTPPFLPQVGVGLPGTMGLNGQGISL